jgi:hypothetical protein
MNLTQLLCVLNVMETEKMSDWIEYMAFTKYKVNKKTNEHENLGGWVKEVGVYTPKKKKVTPKIESKVVVEEDEYL